jgi:hypothetical protein
VNDTTPEVASLVVRRFAAMSPSERVAVAIQMNRTARRIVVSSLREDLTPAEQRRQLCVRLYGPLADAAFPLR